MVELGGTADATALVPGSVGGVVALAEGWANDASRMRVSCDALDGMRVPQSWVGSAADAFASYLSGVRNDARHIHDSLATAAQVLRDYAETLWWAQGQASTAIDMWEDARSTEAGVTGLVATVSAVNHTATDDPRTAAQDMLAAARSQVATAGASAARRIRAVKVDIPRRRSTKLGALATANASGAVRETHIMLLGMAASDQPKVVTGWWRSLTPAERADLIKTFPAIVGNLEGVDYASRDIANRDYLRQQIAEAKERIASAERAYRQVMHQSTTEQYSDGPGDWNERAAAAANRRADAESQLDALLGIEKARAKETGMPRQLISLTSDEPPLAALSIGNMDTARNITYAVPGMNESTAHGGMGGWVHTANNIWEEQKAMARTSDHAVVAWMGHDTPKLAEEASFAKAQVGGGLLDRALLGTEAANGGARRNVVGFSYGGSTAVEGLVHGRARVDAVAIVAAPGISFSAWTARVLNADRVFVGANDETWKFGYEHPLEMRTDPMGRWFGAEHFGTRGADGLNGVTAHAAHTDTGTGYFDRRTESLRNVAALTTGHYSEVTGDQ